MRSIHSALIGQLEESLEHSEKVRHLSTSVSGVDDWFTALDVLAVRCHTHLGHSAATRDFVDAVAAAGLSDATTEVLCPGALSFVAYSEGSLREAADLAAQALAAARRLGFDRHEFGFDPARVTALLALEHHELITAEELTERLLAMLADAGRPPFSYMCQVDRARIWAAGGEREEALASLPAARATLRSEHSPLLAQADELEARLRIDLGDRSGAAAAASRLPPDRRLVVTAMLELAAGDFPAAGRVLVAAPQRGLTPRLDLELQLLRAGLAIHRDSPQAPRLVKDALSAAERNGFVQTVIETSPQLVDHVISESSSYRMNDHLAALIAAGVEARRSATSPSHTGTLPDPLTSAELRVLAILPQRLTYADMASDLHLSLNTVKTHLRRTYMKLGVTSRSAAVRRAYRPRSDLGAGPPNHLQQMSRSCDAARSVAYARDGTQVWRNIMDEISEEKLEDIEALFVQTAARMSSGPGERITLSGLSPSTIYFADRPKRDVGHMSTSRFVGLWADGENSFEIDPPNAVLSFAEPEDRASGGGGGHHPEPPPGGRFTHVRGGPARRGAARVDRTLRPVHRSVRPPLSPVSAAGMHRRERRRMR